MIHKFNFKITALVLAIILVVSAVSLSVSFTFLNNIGISESDIYCAYRKVQGLAGSNVNNMRNSFADGAGRLKDFAVKFRLDTRQRVLKHGSDVYICFKYTQNSYMHLVIGRCGINDMMGIKKIYVDTNRYNSVSTVSRQKPLLLVEAHTDWIGPYYIKSLVHDYGGKEIFTGGWHGIEGDTTGKAAGKATGKATAKTESITVKVDGEEIADDIEYEGDVEIIADNYIKACNTLNEDIYVLNEVVDYRISHRKIDVELVSTALEDALLSKYYGLQSQNSAWKGKVVYGDGSEYEIGEYSDSGISNGKNRVNSYTVISRDGKHKLCVTIDAGFGLGKLENLGMDKPAIFTEPYGKTYFNLVNGKSLKLVKGDRIKWRGSYEFK